MERSPGWYKDSIVSTYMLSFVYPLLLGQSLIILCIIPPTREFFGFSITWESMGHALVTTWFMYVTAFIAAYIGSVADEGLEKMDGPAPDGEDDDHTNYVDGISSFRVVLSDGFLPAIVEEVFYRGVLTPLFIVVFAATSVPLEWGIVYTSFLFGAAHFHPGRGGLLRVIDTFVSGLGLGFAYAITGNLFVPIFAHVVFNSSIMLLVYLHTVWGWALPGDRMTKEQATASLLDLAEEVVEDLVEKTLSEEDNKILSLYKP